MNALLDLIARHRQGHAVGVTSICSAHPIVIEASLRHALRHDDAMVLFEATCNQVNQDGGYTGMTPADFVSFVRGIARQVGFDAARIVLGGDHLGPNPWTHDPPDAAMAKAEVMVAAYVAAGFRKIHLDCSMSCAGDPTPLPEAEIVQARRAAGPRGRARACADRRRAAGVRHRHRGARAGWRDGSHRGSGGDDAAGGARHHRGASPGF